MKKNYMINHNQYNYNAINYNYIQLLELVKKLYSRN